MGMDMDMDMEVSLRRSLVKTSTRVLVMTIIMDMAMAMAMVMVMVMAMAMVGGAEGGSIGVNYGRVANNLPSPQEVVTLIKQLGVQKVKLYDADPSVLASFAGSGIDLVIAIPNQELPRVASSQHESDKWLSSYVVPHLPATRIVAIAVGNEVLSSPRPEVRSLAPSLLPAVRNIHSSLSKLGLHSHIKVSTPHTLSILASSFPPSMGSFSPSIANPFMKPLLDFLASINSVVMINVYPFFAYESQPRTISLSYALFQGSSSHGVNDPHSGLFYTNLFDAQLDAFFAAMAALGHPDMPVVVTETGWPSKGEEAEVGATPKNAETYITNLIKHITSNVGTPRKPNASIDAYIFALFNENMKDGPKSERNYGLFYPNQHRVYELDLVSTRALSSGSGPREGDEENKHNSHSHSYHSQYRNRWGSGASAETSLWCVANGSADMAALQAAMDYACGPGRADCSSIQPNQPCFYPNTLVAHASFAFNSYYQLNKQWGGTCSFQGASQLTKQDPSYHGCKYVGSV